MAAERHARRARQRLARPAGRARSHCRFPPPLIHFAPESLTYSAPPFLKRQCDRTEPYLQATADAAYVAGSMDMAAVGGLYRANADGIVAAWCVYILEHLVGENMHRYHMSITRLECQVSELVDSDTCPHPTTGGRCTTRSRRPRTQTQATRTGG